MKHALLTLLILSLLAVTACKEEAPKEAAPVVEAEPSLEPEQDNTTMKTPPEEMMHGTRPEPVLSVPEELQDVWEAVKIIVTNKANDKSETFAVKRGKMVEIKGSALKFTVTDFIPNFTMGGGIMTSLDENPDNPAVMLVVTEYGKEIWAKVIFMQFPDTHAFEHDDYTIVMDNFVPKTK